MSGFVGIALKDKALDVPLLEAMTAFLAFRGPDGTSTWSCERAGLGHALLRTTREDKTDRQPLTLDGRYWLVADARIDGREELISKLKSQGNCLEKDCPDSHLILSAYILWGADCLQHLIGDFAFVIWDTKSHTLFGARDHFGIKPFYYCSRPKIFLVSNTLQCLLEHTEISREVNEVAIGDYLMFGSWFDPAITLFDQIRQLPAAHTLTWRAGELKIKRYWQLPIEEPLDYRREEDYQQELLRIFGEAVKDRLRWDRVAISLSGGMDSTAVAALAKRANLSAGRQSALKGFSFVFDSIIADQERRYINAAATGLSIPVEYLAGDNFVPMDIEGASYIPTPTPLHAFEAQSFEFHRMAATFSPVILTGMGGDPAMYITKVTDVRPITRILKYAPGLMQVFRQGGIPPLGLKTRILAALPGNRAEFSPPAYIRKTFSAKLGLPRRHEKIEPPPPNAHPTRPAAYELLSLVFWSGGLKDLCDPERTGFPLEHRHPFLDIRLIRFLLRVPPWPHFFHKRILRRAMTGFLPPEILQRPKAPLRGWRFASFLQKDAQPVIAGCKWLPALEEWVEVDILRDSLNRDLNKLDSLSALDNRRLQHSVDLLCLAKWLSTNRKSKILSAV